MKRILDIFLSFLYGRNGYKSPHSLYIPLSEEGWQKLNRLGEQSGINSKDKLLAHGLTLLEIIINHEMRGGKVRLIEPNGVDSENLDLLDQINGTADGWKDE
jgi:hypothetical protein